MSSSLGNRIERWLLFDPKVDSQELKVSPRGIVDRIVDGLHLRLYRFTNRKDAPVTLFAHGNGGSIDTRSYIISTFQQNATTNLVMFDYSGFGRSTGVMSQTQVLKDILDVFDYLTHPNGHPFGLDGPWDPSQIIGWGESFGGAVVAYLAQHRPTLKGIVLMSTFPNLVWIAKHTYGNLAGMAFSYCCADQLDTLHRLKTQQISPRMPIVILHSHHDEVIPIDGAIELVTAHRSTSTHLIVILGTHQRPIISPTQFTEIWDRLGILCRDNEREATTQGTTTTKGAQATDRAQATDEGTPATA
jgi:pimeloyl-ACP methyl ester carboxylesterase